MQVPMKALIQKKESLRPGCIVVKVSHMIDPLPYWHYTILGKSLRLRPSMQAKNIGQGHKVEEQINNGDEFPCMTFGCTVLSPIFYIVLGSHID